MYKTGDLARYLPSGELVFLGRRDQQVKLRGYRIELDEITAVLMQHPSVREAVALARQDAPGDQRLVAYIVQASGVSGQGPEPEPRSPIADRRSPIAGLREWLAARLPDYMVPSTFVALAALPLSPNGKVDRAALPAPDRDRAALANPYVAPRDLLEIQLAQIWEDILGVRPIGVQDDFFELGGHSLNAVRLMARINQRLGQSLPLATLFQGATVAHLAGLLRRQARSALQSPLAPIQPRGARTPFFCMHPAGGEVLCYVDLARRMGDDQPFYGLQALGLDDAQTPLDDIPAMASRYLAAIQEVQPEGPYLLGGWSGGGVIAFEAAQQLAAQGREVGLLALIDTPVPRYAEQLTQQEEIDILRTLAQEHGISVQGLAPHATEEQLTAILEHIQQENTELQEVGLAKIRQIMRVAQANYRAIRTYALARYPGRVTFFQAAESIAPGSPDQYAEWCKLAAGGVERHIVPGSHLSMIQDPHVGDLAERLNSCIAAVRGAASPDPAGTIASRDDS